MSRTGCDHEDAVSAALFRDRDLPEGLANHASACAYCREIIAASQLMQALVKPSETSLVLPDAKLVWWRAQLSEQRARTNRTTSLLGWLERASGAAVLLGLAVLVAVNWFAIQSETMKILFNLAPQFALVAYSLATLAPALLLLAAMSLAYPLFVGD